MPLPVMTATPQSSNVDSWGYDQTAAVLYVKFKSGSVYAYEGVPMTVANEMSTAPSVGIYLRTVIQRAYRGRELSEREASAA